jgi:hypothetical protein
MNPRERVLAAAVVALVLLAGGVFLFHQLYLSPLWERDAAIETAQQDLEKRKDELLQARAEKLRLERLQLLSLPADPILATREYEKYLNDLLVRSGFTPASVQIAVKQPTAVAIPGKKQPVYTVLQFVVSPTGRLDNLVRMMENFYQTGLLHAIKSLSVEMPQLAGPDQRPDTRRDELRIQMTVEALIVNGAPNRPYLLPNIDSRLLALDVAAALRAGPTGMAYAVWAAGPTGPRGPSVLASPHRNYSAIAAKNIFLGPPTREESVEIAPYVYLTHIVVSDQSGEAYLYDRFNEAERKLTSRGQATFRDSTGQHSFTMRAEQIDVRDLVFSVGEGEKRYYRMHVGQNIEDALQQPLSADQVQALGTGRAEADAAIKRTSIDPQPISDPGR